MLEEDYLKNTSLDMIFNETERLFWPERNLKGSAAAVDVLLVYEDMGCVSDSPNTLSDLHGVVFKDNHIR